MAVATPQEESSLREGVHYCLDAVQSTLLRILDLPLIGVFAISAAVALLLCLASLRLAHAGRWSVLAVPLRLSAAIIVLGALPYALDRQLLHQQELVEAARIQNQEAICAVLDHLQQDGRHSSIRIDEAAAASRLEQSFTGVSLRTIALDDAIALVRFHVTDPMVSGALAIVDLGNPRVQVVIDASLGTKTLTSQFGAAHHCAVAVNGEAGMSPLPNCGLGCWRGHLVVAGRAVVLEEAGNPRPFLAFDRENRARFVAASDLRRALGPSDYNVIWGRVDVVVGGVVQTEPYRYNQPRTAMGIDEDGKRLCLLVVDGRQPRHSVGFTRKQAGEFMRAFEVCNAMLCDEGGSSCMFVDAFGGLVTMPSDNHGEERPTYTHFGVALRPSLAAKDH